MNQAVATREEDDFVRAFSQKFVHLPAGHAHRLWDIAHNVLESLPPGSTLMKWALGEREDRERVEMRIHRVSIEDKEAILWAGFTSTQYAFFCYRLGGVFGEARNTLIKKVREANEQAALSRGLLSGTGAGESKKKYKNRTFERLAVLNEHREILHALEPQQALILVLWLATKRNKIGFENFVTTDRAFMELIEVAELPQFPSEKELWQAILEAEETRLLGRSVKNSKNYGSLYILAAGTRMAKELMAEKV